MLLQLSSKCSIIYLHVKLLTQDRSQIEAIRLKSLEYKKSSKLWQLTMVQCKPGLVYSRDSRLLTPT